MKCLSAYFLMLMMVVGCGQFNESPEDLALSDSDTGEASSDDDTEESTDASAAGEPASDNPCAFPLVRLQTGQDDSCSGGNDHYWPIGMDETACHGWQGADNSGSTHDNSANTIRCNGDGTFEFTQYAGNIGCEGTGVRKVYSLNVCEQDIPPMLYTVAIDLTCCSEPDSPQCLVGIPTVGVSAGQTTLNGVVCEP